jgi:hypothetical protein
MIANNIRHIKKIQYGFSSIFDRVEYLIIKFIIEIQIYIKINDEKFIKYFLI